jgi:hypothetical protein
MIILKIYRPLALLAASLLAACVHVPAGPSMMVSVLPSLGKDIEQFRNDDYLCRQFAHEQVSGISANKTAAWIVQQRYDFSYLQCMYAQGHRILPADGQVLEDSTKSNNTNLNKNIPLPDSRVPVSPNL